MTVAYSATTPPSPYYPGPEFIIQTPPQSPHTPPYDPDKPPSASGLQVENLKIEKDDGPKLDTIKLGDKKEGGGNTKSVLFNIVKEDTKKDD